MYDFRGALLEAASQPFFNPLGPQSPCLFPELPIRQDEPPTLMGYRTSGNLREVEPSLILGLLQTNKTTAVFLLIGVLQS